MEKKRFLIIYICFLYSSSLLWLFTILTTRLTFSTANIFSYFTLLPWTYWLSLSLLLIAFSWHMLNTQYFSRQVLFDILLIFLFALVLFGTPCFVEQTPRMLDVYGHTSSALVVQSTGNAGPSLISQNVQSAAYEVNYPGFFILISFVLSLTGLSWINVVQYYPIFLMVLISFLIYVIARKFSPSFSILAPIVFLGFAWFEEFHLSPDSFAIVLYLLVWLIFVELLQRRKIPSNRLLLIPLLTIFFSIVVSHAGGPLFILLNLIVFLVLGFFSLRFRDQLSRKSMLFLFLIILVFYFAWSINGAETSFSGTVTLAANSLKSLSVNAIVARTAGLSSSYSFVNFLREAEIGIINLVAIVFGLFLLRSNNNRRSGVLLLTWWLSCWGFAIYSFGSAGSYIERPALFSLIPVGLIIPYFLATMKKSWRLKLLVIISVLVVGAGCFILPITRNANDVFETPPLSSMSAANFAISETSSQVIIGGHNLAVEVLYAAPNTALEALYDQLDSKNIPYTYLFNNNMLIQNSSLLLFDEPAYAYAVNYGNGAGYQQIQNFSNSQFSRIYDNDEATIFLNRLTNFNATKEIDG